MILVILLLTSSTISHSGPRIATKRARSKMNIGTRVEWTELRYEYGEFGVYFIIAIETSSGWRILEQDKWESQQYAVSGALAAKLESVAKYAKSGFLEGTLRTGSVVLLVATPSNDSAFRIRHSDRAKSVATPWVSAGVIGEIRFNRFRQAPLSRQKQQGTWLKTAA
jgi:hypothetical protein